MSWIPLHVHSQYSILDCTASIPQLIQCCKDHNIPAIALTDHGNMFGVVEFYKACTAANIKPIIGCELWVAPGDHKEKKKVPGQQVGYPIVLLAQNNLGYHNLCKLSSLGYIEGFYYYPRVSKELLTQYSEGLICLSGSPHARIPVLIDQDQDQELKEELTWFKSTYADRFYLEIQRHEMSEEKIHADRMDREGWVLQHYRDYIAKQKKVNAKLVELSSQIGIGCVATNDTHYIHGDDWRAQEILVNVQTGEPCEIWERDSLGNPKNRIPNPKRKIYPSHEFSFKSPQEMSSLFSDIPEALENTAKIADLCNCTLDFDTKHYPVYTPPHLVDKTLTKEKREKAAADFLYELCTKGIEERYTEERLKSVQEKYPDQDPKQVVQKRLDHEFEIIVSKGMADYILIVFDFIHWAKKHKIPVGPGRGSAAGSIISYLIGITDIEPLRFNLFFERFINPERISYPDIDVDICMDRRSEVIDYTIRKYGKDRVAQIITFGKMKAKMAIKDVGRVLSVPLVKVNQLAKLIPEDPNMTLDKALEIDPELQSFIDSDEEAKMVFSMARKTEGSIRNTSIHAAGMIISEDAIFEHIPVCVAKDADMIVTQYAMKPVEAVGMLKIDFLGLKTLTSIQKTVDAVHRSTGKLIDWANLPLDDSATFHLLNQGKTLGVFQLESGGMQELAKQLHIDRFEEIIAVGALYRPGPMDMIPSFIQRKHGKEKIEIDHPLMEDILAETYGIMVYQEQVMQIASRLAGYTLGEGDVLRKAMGKKDQAEMTRQREKFVKGAVEKGIAEETAIAIFDKIAKFASYGFNKSHAAAYAFLSYVTAYLKANYPHEWMASLMTCDRDDLSKVAKFIRECHAMGIAILPPDVNEANGEFTATKEGVRFALSGVKGVGSGAVDAIIEERERNGKFKSLYDLIQRVDTKKVGKKNIELLIEAGAFDFTNWSRDAMRENLDVMYERAVRDQKDAEKGVMNFFSLIEEDKNQEFSEPPSVQSPSSKIEILHREKELLGFYLTGHPMDAHKNTIKLLSCVPMQDFEKLDANAVIRSAFIVETVQTKITSKSQRKFAILIISDGIERIEMPIWPDLFEQNSHLLRENQMLFAILQIDRQEGQLRINCKHIEDLIEMDQKKIANCDDLYERYKHRAKLFAAQRKKGKSNKQPNLAPKKEKKPMLLKIKLDVDSVHLSHILKLKETFRKNAGNSPVEINFISDGVSQGKVQIEQSWGVEVGQALFEGLQKVPALIEYTESVVK